MTKFVLVGVLAFAAAGFGNIASVLQTGDLPMTVDSVEFRGALITEVVVTTGFGGDPETEDTFRFSSRVAWPERGVTVFYTVDGNRRDPVVIDSLEEDLLYELPGNPQDAPGRIKFLRGGAVGEGARVALPVRVSVAPNPLVTSSTVRLAVRRAGDLRVEVYDGTGQVVRVLSSGRAAPGHVVLNWDGADSAGVRVSTGVYFVRAALDGSRSLAKVVVTE
ncbi:MAG: FlgD immunoglobulin-like domain containing protein [bacterium]